MPGQPEPTGIDTDSTLTEPDPGAHVERGTQVSGERDRLLAALPKVLDAAFAGGASQVTLQVRRDA